MDYFLSFLSEIMRKPGYLICIELIVMICAEIIVVTFARLILDYDRDGQLTEQQMKTRRVIAVTAAIIILAVYIGLNSSDVQNINQSASISSESWYNDFKNMMDKYFQDKSKVNEKEQNKDESKEDTSDSINKSIDANTKINENDSTNKSEDNKEKTTNVDNNSKENLGNDGTQEKEQSTDDKRARIIEVTVPAITVFEGEEVILPDFLPATLSNGETVDVAVSWDNYELKLGENTITGTVENGWITVTVKVEEAVIVAVEAPLITVLEGEEVILPKFLPATLSNGEIIDVPVIWDDYELELGENTIMGIAADEIPIGTIIKVETRR